MYLELGEDLLGGLPASLPCLLVLAEEFLYRNDGPSREVYGPDGYGM
jgi:hypothetical protein